MRHLRVRCRIPELIDCARGYAVNTFGGAFAPSAFAIARPALLFIVLPFYDGAEDQGEALGEISRRPRLHGDGAARGDLAPLLRGGLAPGLGLLPLE
ncbi:MAG: hypothetical protein ACRDU4_11995, partial [Mycobacterium sp.]